MKLTTSPFTILVDTREVKPWTFNNIPGYKGQGKIVVLRQWQSLGNGYGDYTLMEAESLTTKWRISIERKSLPDLFSTILSRRKQFVAELENLNKMEYAAVVVEAPLEKAISYFPPQWTELEISPDSQLSRQRSVIGSIQAWQLRYPMIRWWFLSRSYAEIWVYRLFHRFWEDKIQGE